jgi:hypothetical protein
MRHDQLGGCQFARDAPDPGRRQVVNGAGQRARDPQDLTVLAGDDLEVHAVAVVLAGVERPVCGDPVDNFPPNIAGMRRCWPFRQGPVGRGGLARGSHRRLSHRGVRRAVALAGGGFPRCPAGPVRGPPGSLIRPHPKGYACCGPGREGRFLRRQVLTSGAIRGSLLTDLALGGLDYPIEHTCSRPCRGRACVTPRRRCGRFAPSAAFPIRRQACWPPLRRYCGTSIPLAGRPGTAAGTVAADPGANRDPGHAEDSLRPAPQAGAYW